MRLARQLRAPAAETDAADRDQPLPVDPSLVAVLGFVALFAPDAAAHADRPRDGAVGVGGFGAISGFDPALKLLAQSPIRTATDAGFAVIPMFLLMGTIASASGMSGELFHAANSFLGHRSGGLGMATIAACAGFAAISGSSVATAATFSAVAYPEMRRFGYPQSFATGVIAAGGTLGAILPPSLVLAVYSLITQQDVGRLYIAGIAPRPARGRDVHRHHRRDRLGAARLPAEGRRARAGPSGWRAVRGVWAITLLFVFVIGGMYGGAFTADRGGEHGRRRRLPDRDRAPAG